MSLEKRIAEAATRLDVHVRETVAWHFSPETGSPFWLDWREKAGWDPVREIRSWNDLMRFPHFQGNWLRDEPNERWIPQAYHGKPFTVFETGGTSGLPKQRLSWEDHRIDYTEFSTSLDERAFPLGAHWLMLGPTGPRRLRLSIEHLAHLRGGSCYFVDLDPRWVKKLLAAKDFKQAQRYQEHVIEQGLALLESRPISCLFTTPKLLEALGEKVSLFDAGIRGVFCGGTSMTPQVVRFLIEEVLQNRVAFVPTYGNTLMGLAKARTLRPEDKFSLTYYAPQPRAVLRLVKASDTSQSVAYGECGGVELTTLTREFFMPRFLERDEALRRPPCEEFPWDGVGEVRPLGGLEQKLVEGVY